MATPPIVQTLPYVAWILLAALAFGSFAFVVVTRQLSGATPGYLRFTAFSAALLAALTLPLGDAMQGLPALSIPAPSPPLPEIRFLASCAFAVLAIAWAALLARPRPALVTGIAAIAAGLVALAAVALMSTPALIDWTIYPAFAVPVFVELAVLSFVTGGSMATIVLGHWYLVTPKLSERPLILQTQMLLGGLILQALLFVTWTTLGGGPVQSAFSAFTTGPVLLVALRLIITIAFPVVLTWMAWRTARTRSMESATGLLYINFAAVMAGTIGAAALYLSSGILV
jgi:hypothetical protein